MRWIWPPPVSLFLLEGRTDAYKTLRMAVRSYSIAISRINNLPNVRSSHGRAGAGIEADINGRPLVQADLNKQRDLPRGPIAVTSIGEEAGRTRVLRGIKGAHVSDRHTEWKIKGHVQPVSLQDKWTSCRRWSRLDQWIHFLRTCTR